MLRLPRKQQRISFSCVLDRAGVGRQHLGGVLEYGGMPSFKDALKADQVQSIQAYVLSQAAAASKPAPSKAP